MKLIKSTVNYVFISKIKWIYFSFITNSILLIVTKWESHSVMLKNIDKVLIDS